MPSPLTSAIRKDARHIPASGRPASETASSAKLAGALRGSRSSKSDSGTAEVTRGGGRVESCGCSAGAAALLAATSSRTGLATLM